MLSEIKKMEKDLKDRHHTRRLEIPLGSQIQASGWDCGQHQCDGDRDKMMEVNRDCNCD